MSRTRREAHQAEGVGRQLEKLGEQGGTDECRCEYTGVQRDTDGTILRGLSLPCGCPLDADCNGWH